MNWKRKVNRGLTIVMEASVGVFLGMSLSRYWEWKKYPGLFAMQSAPWYTSILLYAAATAGTLAVCGLIKWWMKRGSGKDGMP